LLLIPLAVDQAFHLVRAASARSLAALGAALVALNLPNAFTRTFTADEAERGILTVRALRFQGKVARADTVSEELVRRFPKDANVQMLRAEGLVRTKGCTSAIPHLEATVELAPETTAPRMMLGSCYDALGNERAAYRAFAALLSVHPYHRDALKSIGMIYARHGRADDALRVLKRFVGSGYDDPQVNDWVRRLAQMQ
jgi:Flp pilus assembly protein TadD